jgi:hypothetical protein
MKKVLLLALLFGQMVAQAQTDTTKVEEINFDDFGNADEKQVKTYCTQKVVGLSPSKLISVGYESHLNHTQTYVGDKTDHTIGGSRLQFNAPVISKSSMILSLGLNYWSTKRNNSNSSDYFRNLKTMGLNATMFKPLNNKNFIIAQASADHNANYSSPVEFNAKALTYSGAVMYGWKKNENTMFAVGISRTYRAGEALIIPTILYNKTYSAKWGIEATLPAKAHVRRNLKPNTYLLAGYEIEGNTFLLNKAGPVNSDLFARRGEIKPRIVLETKLKNFLWLSAQTGLRYDYRYNVHNKQNPTSDNSDFLNQVFLSNAMYFNVSLNLVSP